MSNEIKQHDGVNMDSFISLVSVEEPDYKENLKQSEGELAVDVFQTETHLVIVAPVAGVEASDLDIAVNDTEVLTIRGKREASLVQDEKNYLTRECFWGAFSRSILLPEGLNTDEIRATFRRGVLKIEIPKVRLSRIKKVKIKEG